MDKLMDTLTLVTNAISMAQKQAQEQFELTKLLTHRVMSLEREVEALVEEAVRDDVGQKSLRVLRDRHEERVLILRRPVDKELKGE